MHRIEQTTVMDDNFPVDGYLVVAPLSHGTHRVVRALQENIAKQLPKDSLWLPCDEQLHITLLHIISPDKTRIYPEARPELFEKLRDEAVGKLAKVIPADLDIELKLKDLKGFADAIIIRWQDNGAFDDIRNRFVQLFNIPEATRRPPVIVHTTIARYRQSFDLSLVEGVVDRLTPPATTEHTTLFHLVHETKIFMQQHEVLVEFP